MTRWLLLGYVPVENHGFGLASGRLGQSRPSDLGGKWGQIGKSQVKFQPWWSQGRPAWFWSEFFLRPLVAQIHHDWTDPRKQVTPGQERLLPEGREGELEGDRLRVFKT